MTLKEYDTRVREILMSSTNEEDIILMFATHYCIKEIQDSKGNKDVSYWEGWVGERELETNMRNLCQSDDEANVEDWVRFFVKNLSQMILLIFWCKCYRKIQNSQPVEAEKLDLWFISLAYHLNYMIASRHLSAYLEKVGVRSARNVYNKSKKYLKDKQLSYYLHDLYQIACYISRTPHNFFSSFSPQHSLESYVDKRMTGKINEEVLRISGMRKRRSDSGLLKSTTRKRLKEALENQGYRQPYLYRYLLARDCFDRIYAPQQLTNNNSLPKPTDEQLQQIADLYNNLAQSSPQITNLSQANQETIKQWLIQCVEAIRWHETRLTTQAISLDCPIKRDENSHPLSETILDNGIDFQGESIENQEIQERIPGLTAFLTELLARIDEDTRNHLLLMHGFDLDSRSIAPIFGINHSTVCRRCNKTTQRLLKQVGQWARENLKVKPDSEILNEMGTPLLNKCLKEYYENLIFELVFQNRWQQLNCKSQNILYLYYFKQEDVAAIADQLKLSESEVSKELETGLEELKAAIKEWTQNHLNISPDLLNPLADKIAALVQTLIVNSIASDFT
ncbi:hypothetical protein B7486_40615 [cyanobacterium TDX16]|nr:hypothetical protein B7486_40615 [cyanobacterium TDX16]